MPAYSSNARFANLSVHQSVFINLAINVYSELSTPTQRETAFDLIFDVWVSRWPLVGTRGHAFQNPPSVAVTQEKSVSDNQPSAHA